MTAMLLHPLRELLTLIDTLTPVEACVAWQKDLFWLHGLSDLAIALVYYSIQIALLGLQRRYPNCLRNRLMLLVTLFILAYGTTHFLSFLALWYPDYWLLGLTKFFTAGLSILTVWLVLPSIPVLLAMTSSNDLDKATQALKDQVVAREHVEKALSSSEERFRRVFLSAPNGNVLTAMDGRCLLANQSFCRLLGYSEAEMQELNIQTLTHPDDLTLELTSLQQLIQGEVALWETEARSLHKEGQTVWVHKSMILLYNSDGQPDYFVTQTYDITQRKAAEVVLAQSRQHDQEQLVVLGRLHNLKDDFLSTVSHELRSPVANMKMAIKMLHIVLGDLDLLPNAEKSKRYLTVLNTECDREINLINDLLDLQRLTAENAMLQIEAVDLAQWLPPIVERFSARANSRQQLVTVNAEGVFVVRTDLEALDRIVAELLNNACKYTPPHGQINVGLYALLGTIHLAVTNTGVEIPAPELLRIFDKFYRIPSADPWKQGGTGLGLPLVQRLAKLLDGVITVRSSVAQTTFVLELPLLPVEALVEAIPIPR